MQAANAAAAANTAVTGSVTCAPCGSRHHAQHRIRKERPTPQRWRCRRRSNRRRVIGVIPAAAPTVAAVPLCQELATTILKAPLDAKHWREVVESIEDGRFRRLSVGEAQDGANASAVFCVPLRRAIAPVFWFVSSRRRPAPRGPSVGRARSRPVRRPFSTYLSRSPFIAVWSVKK